MPGVSDLGPKLARFTPKWDIYGDFSDQILIHFTQPALKKSRNCPTFVLNCWLIWTFLLQSSHDSVNNRLLLVQLTKITSDKRFVPISIIETLHTEQAHCCRDRWQKKPLQIQNDRLPLRLSSTSHSIHTQIAVTVSTSSASSTYTTLISSQRHLTSKPGEIEHQVASEIEHQVASQMDHILPLELTNRPHIATRTLSIHSQSGLEYENSTWITTKQITNWISREPRQVEECYFSGLPSFRSRQECIIFRESPEVRH